MKNTMRWIVGVGALALQWACPKNENAKPLKSFELAGHYSCNLPGEQQAIELDENGAFRQTIQRRSGVIVFNTGKWATSVSPMGFYVLLASYNFAWPSGIPGAGTVGECFAKIKRSEGRVRLEISAGAGLYCARDAQDH
jgi:hypothetical protein